MTFVLLLAMLVAASFVDTPPQPNVYGTTLAPMHAAWPALRFAYASSTLDALLWLAITVAIPLLVSLPAFRARRFEAYLAFTVACAWFALIIVVPARTDSLGPLIITLF